MSFFKYNQLLLNISKLLGSGLLTSIGFVFLSSGSFAHFDSKLSVQILLFIQFQMIGLTISKYGVDNLVFARLLVNKHSIYNPIQYIQSKGIYLALACAIIYSIVSDYRYAIIILITMVLDVFSTITIVQMNAKGNLSYAFITNVLAYPLFFLFLYISSFIYEYNSFCEVIIPFCFCIFLRFILSKYYISRESKKVINEKISLDVPIGMGLQQILNYFLFKADQVIITLGTVIIVLLKLNHSEIQQILFLSKFPELVTGVLLSLSFLYAPFLSIDNKNKYIFLIKKYFLIFIIYCVLTFIVLLVYLQLWKNKDMISQHLIIAYFFNSIFIIIVNMITLGYLKTKKLKYINRNLIISCLAGFIFIFIVFVLKLANYYVFVVPIQLFVFLIMPLITQERDEIY